MIVGVAGHGLFARLSLLMPYLIFTMLLLTFCKISIRQMRLQRLHLWLLLMQLAGSVAVYFAMLPLGSVVAQGVMVCVICPTATAAAVITHKLGGNAAVLTTYTLISNLGTAVAVPLLFPLIEPCAGVSFGTSFAVILGKVFPLLICPFIAASLLRRFCPRVHGVLERAHGAAFYIWTFALAIVAAQIFVSMQDDETAVAVKVTTAVATLVLCLLQFMGGKAVGSLYGERISAGQALGQKNTIFAIWMAHAYLNPAAAIGPGAYVLWQNVVNSWQIYKKDRVVARSQGGAGCSRQGR